MANFFSRLFKKKPHPALVDEKFDFELLTIFSQFAHYRVFRVSDNSTIRLVVDEDWKYTRKHAEEIVEMLNE